MANRGMEDTPGLGETRGLKDNKKKETFALMSQATIIVKAKELQPGMVIKEITELSIDYAMLDETTVNFLQGAFIGASAVILVDTGALTIPIGKLKPFDQLQSIVNIPGSLKTARVTDDVITLALKNGLQEFKVSTEDGAAPKAPSVSTMTVGSEEAKQAHIQKREEIKKFLDTLEQSSKQRDTASTLVEEMLDQGRKGNFSSKGVEAVVDDLLKQGSSPAMKAIAGLKGSDQTYAHCTDMSVILQEAYSDILEKSGKTVSDQSRRFTLISGFMHDIGKSEVPKDILESTTRFDPDSKEMIIMRNHTTYGARILSEMGMPQVTINVAHYHHVKKDSSMLTSYPAIDYTQVHPITRLAAVTDVYQALIGRRSYKRNWVPGKAVEYLYSLRSSEFDETMLDKFLESLGRYPVGSLLRLSTGDLAFVIHLAPYEYPERPIVAVVENAQGELLTNQDLVDLMLEPHVQVEEVIDHYEHFNETDEQAYQIFQSIHIA